MKKEYKFDSKTGTMVPVGEAPKLDIDTVLQSAQLPFPKERIEFKTTGKAVTPPQLPSAPKQAVTQLVKVQRSKTVTPMQLVNEAGLPEAYLTPVNTGILMFREGQDYDIYQIADERSKTVLAYIGGYGLQMCFNMQELNTMEKIEQCLEGLKKLFRHQIMNQVLPQKDTEQR